MKISVNIWRQVLSCFNKRKRFWEQGAKGVQKSKQLKDTERAQKASRFGLQSALLTINHLWTSRSHKTSAVAHRYIKSPNTPCQYCLTRFRRLALNSRMSSKKSINPKGLIIAIHSIDKWFLNVSYVLRAVLTAGDTVVKTNMVPDLVELAVLWWRLPLMRNP